MGSFIKKMKRWPNILQHIVQSHENDKEGIGLVKYRLPMQLLISQVYYMHIYEQPDLKSDSGDWTLNKCLATVI